MQEHWELYMKQIDGHLSSVLVNVGLKNQIDDFMQIYPTIGFVKAKLNTPKQNGLLESSEEDEIFYLEDKLESSLIKFRIGKYASRIISNGYVTFVYYLQFTYNWNDFLDYALNENTIFDIEHGHKDDNEWQFYNNLLYPSIKEWQIINNHKVCDAMMANLDSLSASRAIEHNFYWTANSDIATFIDIMNKNGFSKQKDIEDIGITFYRKDIPHYENIDKLSLELIDISDMHNVMYDGWECSVVKDMKK